MKQIVWKGTLKEGSAVNKNIDLVIYLFIYVEYVWGELQTYYIT